jgi:prepilin-type N-terminal cleavage/methylation domain-containing protein
MQARRCYWRIINMKIFSKQHGFTLIELVMVIILFGIVTIGATRFFLQGVTGYVDAQNVTNANWDGQVSMMRMTRDIRMIRSANDITTNTSAELSFTDVGGNAIDFKLTGSNLMRNTQVLARGVTGLTLTYFDKNGASNSTPSSLHYVTIALTVTDNNTNYTLTTSVELRDLSS